MDQATEGVYRLHSHLRGFASGWMASGSDNPMTFEVVKEEAARVVGRDDALKRGPYEEVLAVIEDATRAIYNNLEDCR